MDDSDEAAEVVRRQLTQIVDGPDTMLTVLCHVASIAPGQAQGALKLAGERLPLPAFGLGHLKRIQPGPERNQLLLLLAPVGVTEEEVRAVTVNLGATARPPVEVPAALATTPEGWDEAAALWPARRPRPARDAGDPSELSVDTLLRADQAMGLALAEAHRAHRNGLPPIGAVVLDPTGEVIAAAIPGANHCRAAYGFADSDDPHCMDGHPLRHCVMEAIEMVAARERVATASQGKRKADTDAYLLTGCDVYTTHEPCVMCGMALLHSRVRSVFYAAPNPALGGLGTRYRLHVQKGLNHRFTVYSGLRLNDALALASAPDTDRTPLARDERPDGNAL